MPLPIPRPDTDLVRFKLVYTGVEVPIVPGVAQGLKLTREPGDNNPAGSFYYRDKLSGTPFIFTGADFKLLYAIETSNARCQTLGLLIEHRGYPGAAWEQWKGEFTCNDCTDWNATACSVKVTPRLNDPYQKLLDNWDKEYNILLTPGPRHTVTAQLGILAEGTGIEFKRIDRDDQADFVGTDGWALFWDDQSYIYQGQFAVPNFSMARDLVLFRYRQREYKLKLVVGSSPPLYEIADRSETGWTPLYPDGAAQGNNQVNVPQIDYVKEPAIAGFRPYKLTGNGGGTPFLHVAHAGDPKGPQFGLNNGAYGLYVYGKGEFLSLDCGQLPSDAGYIDADWLEVTGPDGRGANSAEACNGTGLTIREEVSKTHDRRIFWRFGSFVFSRAIPYKDALYSMLSQTVASYGGQSLLPPTSAQLSEFLTAEVNPATEDSGEDNEIPRLLISAGSDVKRYGATEPATRLLISLKQFLSDSAWWDTGWFIDPATGWLRFEHRAYLEAQKGVGAVVDLRRLEDVLLSHSYSYRVQSLPRYEDLVITNANTEDFKNVAYFAKASIDYGLGACVSTKEGSNRVTFTSSRLTGDVAAGILNGETIPDSAIFVLAPDTNGRLSTANRELSASQLLLRYWRRGRAAGTATVEGPAPQSAPNTVTGDPPPSGPPLYIQSIRPQRVQENVSGRLPRLATLAANARYTTNLGQDGQLGKAELNMGNRSVVTTIWLTVPFSATPPPEVARQFDDSFNKSFG
jgi:hypothetical protein